MVVAIMHRLIPCQLSDHACDSTDQLMLRVQAGDRLAFEQIYYRMVPVIRGFLLSRRWCRLPIEDVVQEVFCRVWQYPRRFIGQSSAETYLLGMVLNVCREVSRDSSGIVSLAHGGVDNIVLASEAAESSDSKDFAPMLKNARATLSHNQEVAIGLVYDDGMAPRDAARVLGCTEKALRRRLEVGRDKLHEFLAARLRRHPPEYRGRSNSHRGR
jgi:RNA polymerase sigma-70 factor, ECF subfamily